MSLLRSGESLVTLRLGRDLVRNLKRGHPWVFREALRDCPPAPAGSAAVLLDQRKGEPVACGWYEPSSPVSFRACRVEPPWKLDDRWALQRLHAALELRKRLFDGHTTGWRLLHGEGDGVPGLVVDVYSDVAVIKLDGPGAEGFWNSTGIADWLMASCGVTSVVERTRERGEPGQLVLGNPVTQPVEFLEHGIRFTADVLRGQKTGFFLDQRDNRQLIRRLARQRRVLNLFSYTGGFSVAAGCGGASQVTSVDIAKAAVAEAHRHWLLNDLPSEQHESVAADVFDFLEAADKHSHDLVIVDPPSFAPSAASVDAALASYTKLAALSAKTTSRGGHLALASCSSHITTDLFLDACQEGLSQARRRATVLALQGQPADHPSPLVMPEFRYLKFLLLRLDG